MLRPNKNYKWAVLGALAVTLLCLYPQFVMWTTRGHEWNGAYAQVHGDEWVYSAYVQALIDGRPRRNDSYTGRDDRPGQIQPESIFSIQFVPAYMIAIPSRLFGLSSSTAFIILGILTPFLSCIAIFWLLHLLTQDERISAAGAVIVLCFGALAGGQGAIHLLETGTQYIYLPFLRRLAPAATFPLFFVFCGLTWRSLTKPGARRLAYPIGAGALLVLLVFSYYYLWTAALAWLAGLTVIWFAARRDNLRQSIFSLGIIFLLFLLAIIPYMIMVSHRLRALDTGLKIETSHAPDLWRVPELIGLVVIAALVFGALRKTIDWRGREALFAASFGLMPFLVFNQQILTGKTVQPYHYSIYIANYLVLIGVVIVSVLWWRGRRKADEPVRYRRVARLVMLALWWGAIEVIVHTRVMVRESEFKDRTAAVCQRLRQLSASDVINDSPDPRPLVLATNDDVAIMIPTFAPQALLWAQNFDFLNIERGENRQRLYTYLYLIGVDPAALREDLSSPVSRFATAVFGHERVLQYVSAARPHPITTDEITEQVKQYEAFVASFNRETAATHVLSYLIVPVTKETNLSNLDKWYERDQGEQVDLFRIYRLRLRPSA